MDRYPILDVLSSGQCSKVTSRMDINTDILAYPKLLYLSDAEEEDNLPDAARPGHERFQSLELIGPQLEQSATDQVARIMALSDDDRNPLLRDEVVDLPEKVSIAEWIEYLVKKGPAILTATMKNPGQTSRILRKLGGEIQMLRPGNDAEDLGDWRDRSQWRRQLSALVSELVMVEDTCSCEVRDAGVFVLTTFEYPTLLEILALELLTGD